MTVETREFTEDKLRELAARGAAELDGAGADDLLAWTDRHFGGSCGGLQHAGRRSGPPRREGASRVEVLFLDTGYLLPRDHRHRDAVESVYDITVLNVTPEHTVEQQDRLLGKDLYARDPGECCRLRKVVPLGRALGNYAAWVTGIRRVESPTRANRAADLLRRGIQAGEGEPAGRLDRRGHAGLHRVARVLVNPLVDEGYPSIGCALHGQARRGADPRSGRWQGSAKTECGLHVS